MNLAWSLVVGATLAGTWEVILKGPDGIRGVARAVTDRRALSMAIERTIVDPFARSNFWIGAWGRVPCRRLLTRTVAARGERKQRKAMRRVLRALLVTTERRAS